MDMKLNIVKDYTNTIIKESSCRLYFLGAELSSISDSCRVIFRQRFHCADVFCKKNNIFAGMLC